MFFVVQVILALTLQTTLNTTSERKPNQNKKTKKVN